jgi:hypothetical protein
VSFAATTLYVASQRVFIVIIYFVIDSVRKILDTPSYVTKRIQTSVRVRVTIIFKPGEETVCGEARQPYS